jgi:hypothetical protein
MANSSNASIGSLVQLWYWNTVPSPDVWAQLGNIRGTGDYGTTKSQVDSTTLDSTAVERIGGLPDGEEFTVTFTTTSTIMTLLKLWIAGTANIDVKVIYPSPISTTDYFTITPLGMKQSGIQPSNLLEITLTARISGAISVTPSHP